ncbi:MAG: DNA-binding MarR family transcriptional regulator [Pseudohongiellaceae bacterium]|jgi:DNA-binding MarR family transcriptional regulator|tara:strand:+ start:780 stop:1364 length:585 start_codon:yes stop_codon:yes gene_type:complete
MSKEQKMDSRGIAELVLHLGRLASGEGLTATQWAVLRYFARANRFSRTPSAFASIHGTTRGTASQTIKNLEAQGYLTSERSEFDKRSIKLSLTDKARTVLKNDVFEVLVLAVDGLPSGIHADFAKTLQRMLGHVVRESGKPHFGTCTSCTYLEGDGCSSEGQADYACSFAGEPLLMEELSELCVNFVPEKIYNS